MKKMKKYIDYILIVLVGLGAFSCDDFLDVMPDNRTMLDTPTKIKELLVTSYPTANYSVIAELSADNFVDNQAPPISLKANAFDPFDSDIFQWEEIRAADDDDSPYFLWEQYYQSIAAANHVLEAIERLEEDPLITENMNPQRGEALILRAYCHFMLVNIFSKTYKDSVTSKQDLGITYATVPEKTVFVQYERNSVAEVYELIAKDIEAGIPLIDDGTYSVPKYHFTTSAAHAFASQFYLYKRDYDKVIEHADAVLGKGNPSSLLRDWKTIYSNFDTEVTVYVDADSPANLLLIPTYSRWARRFYRYRYGSNGSALNATINSSGPGWSGRPPFLSGWVWTAGQEYGLIIPKIGELFEYTDKVAGIGYAHVVKTEFTTDDVLLNRAEAKVMKNDSTAVQDLSYWSVSHRARALTEGDITRFYTGTNTNLVSVFHTTELSSGFKVSEAQKPLIDCVLHFRRLERIFEGHRWFDIKRYGIELTHIAGRDAKKIVLTYDDDRRAIQIPSDVVGAGIEPNPRAPINNTPPSMVVPVY
jgi:hypothetical protein